MKTGTFTANHRSRRSGIRWKYPAALTGKPDKQGLVTLMVDLPVGHPDKPQGGPLLITVAKGAFRPHPSQPRSR